MEHLHSLFVQYHSDALIQRVTSVMPVADALRDNKTILLETHSLILEASADAKMTVLLQALSTIKSRSSFYIVLQARQPNLVKELEDQDAEFVDRCSVQLIQKVTFVMLIADSLKALKIIHEETYSNISVAPTNMAKMRKLLAALNTNKAKSAFYNLFKFNDLTGIELELAGASPQTSSDVLKKIESHPQNAKTVQMEAIQQGTEDQQMTWRKRDRSSTRHRTKIEELLRETKKQNVWNLWFYKDEKYMLGSGGSGTQVYIGVTEDGIDVAVKIITKNPTNKKDFKNEMSHLLNSKLESPYIVRYVTSAQDDHFYYLANQLCEYDLEEYMKYLRQSEQKDKKTATLRRIVEEMLLGLQVLHRADVIHRDLKPRNVLIDKEQRARLADFGISRKLEEGKTTMYTDRAGTQGWEATEIVNQPEKGEYKMSSDIQVAGMLTHFILSDGKHPFGEGIRREVNISEGAYSLADIEHIAKDLIEWMINKEQNKRPKIDQVLNHPYFWDDKRIREVLHNLGNKEEIQEYKNYENNKKLYDAVQKYTVGKDFSDWKTKAPKTWTKIGKNLPNDLLGLLRHLRNALGHQEKEFYKEKMIDEFPDFLISLHRLAMEMGWEY